MLKYKYLLTTFVCLWSSLISLHPQERVLAKFSALQQQEVSKVVKDQGEGKVLYGYCSPDLNITSKNALGFQTKKDIQITTAIRLSQGITNLLKERKIYRLRIGLAAKAENVTAFIRKADGTILWETTRTLDMGWNDLTFDTPFEIPEDKELYCGYTCIQHPEEYIIASENSTSKTNGLWMAAEGEELIAYSNLGNLCLSIEVDGTESEFGYIGSLVRAIPSTPYMLKGSNKDSDITIHLFNEGENRVSSIKLGRSFNGVELEDTVCYLKRTARAGNMSELTLKITPTETGKYTYTLKEMEGNPVLTSPVTTGISFYNNENVIQRMVLIEEFTSQTCGNCPAGQFALHRTIEGNENRVAMVLHHSGYNPDIFSIKESNSYCYFYNSASTYAPAMTMDRTYLQQYDSGGSGGTVFDPRNLTKADFLRQLDIPALVSVNIKSVYDESTRQLSVTVSGFKATDLVGEHVGLTAFLLESKYIASQSNGGASFEHNNFPRYVFSDPKGDVITFKEDGTYKIEYTYTIPESYISTTGAKTQAHPENMHIVAFVSNYDNIFPTNCKVLNANKTNSLNDNVTGVKSLKAGYNMPQAYVKDRTICVTEDCESIQVYNLQGMPVLNKQLEPGIYIIKITSKEHIESVQKVLIR